MLCVPVRALLRKMAAIPPRGRPGTMQMEGSDLLNSDSRDRADNARSVHRRRFIEVHAVGEYTLPPDVYSFTVALQSTKPSTEAAKESVKRRLDYVHHVLHNIHKVPQSSVQTNNDVSRTEASTSVRCHVQVDCSKAKVAEECRNHLIVKLDTSSVKVSPILCSYTAKAKETLRAKAFVQAVNCARRKAETVSLSLGLQLCLPQSIVEHSCKLIPTQHESDPCPEDDETWNSSDCQPLRQRIQESTLSFSSSVTAHFEMAQKRTCHHRSCPKHFPQ